MRIRTSEEATAELTEAARWYDRQSPGLGVEFIAAIDAVVSLIEANPKTGSRPPGIEDSSISRVFVRRFPDHVVYVALPDRIQILAIAHDRRRPAYWAKRLPV